MKIHVFAVDQPQISTGKCVLESNKYDKGKILLIHVIISPVAFPFTSGSPRKTGLHCLLPYLWIALEIWKGNVKVFSDNLNGFYSLFLEIRVPWAVWMFCPYSINHLFLKAEGIQFPRCVLIPRVVPTLLLPFLGKGKILMWKIRGKNSSPRWRVIVPFWLWGAWGIEKVVVASFAQVSRKSWALALDWSYLCAVLWTRKPQERSEFYFILFYFTSTSVIQVMA